MKPRVLILGIDGADYCITQALLVEGRLPNLAALAEAGAWGPVTSTIPPITPPAWTTLMTGQNPGRHGVFDFLPMTGEAFDTPLASRRRSRTLWQALSDRGLRVGTFNLPVTYPPEQLSGFQVSGFDAPSFRPEMALPRAAFEALQATVGEYDLFPLSIQSPEGDPEAVRRHAEVPVAGTRALLIAFPCDVYMVSFQVVDWVQHAALGREMAPGDPASLRRDGVVGETYALVDRCVGELLSEWAAEDTTVLVVSDHGGTAADRLVNLEKLFLDHGLMAYKSSREGDTARLMAQRSRAQHALRWWMRLKAAVPWAVQPLRALARRMRGRLAEYQQGLEIDWSRTRAAPWGEYAQVRLNVKGRDPEGLVEQRDAPALAEQVADLLSSLRDPATGERIYEQVLAGRELYEGPYAADGADVVALPRDERYLAVSARQGVGSLPLLDVQPEVVVPLDPPWGVHAQRGVLFASGPEIAPGARIAHAALADLVPTLLYLLDEAVPEDLDGRPLLETVRPEVVRERPVRTGPPWPPPQAGASAFYSAEEQAQIERRLRTLGYL